MSDRRVGRGAEERVVGGRYRLLERIGSGGMGTVWRAHDELVEREVAVKQPRLPGDPEDEAHQRAAHRLYREARAAARVDHPSAVSIHDVVVEEEDGLPWIVMELIRGESLHELLRRGPVEPAETARIGLAVLGALRAAHSVGIVHRDVKPANVLIGGHGRVILTDFGIAHVQGEESLTATGEFVGSLEFVAPERMSGRTAGPASDLWSLGVLLYAAVEGWSPFRRTTVQSTLAAILSAEPPEPERAGALTPLLVGLLAKEPELRPDAEECAAALAAVAGGPGDPEEPPAGAEPQDAARLAEFGDDIGTVRLAAEPETRVGPRPGGAPAGEGPGPVSAEPIGGEASAEPMAGEAAPAEPVPGEASAEPISVIRPPGATSAPPRRRPLHRRPLPLAGLGALLVATAWTGIALLAHPDTGATTRGTGSTGITGSTGSTGSTPGSTPGWSAHPEKAMGATLALPDQYEEFARQGSETFQPRAVEYAAGSVQVRLTQWDKAPGTPMRQAEQHAATWEFFDDPQTQYTRTSFRGWEAVQSDSTYGEPELRRRVMELFVRTDDGRLYELRVEMPKGTAEEKRGTAVFKSARDRLTIATTP
ncbi:serine/threonine-protein kinase [Streptomyces sp. NPDC003832]